MSKTACASVDWSTRLRRIARITTLLTIAVTIIAVTLTIKAGDSLKTMIPNLLMFIPGVKQETMIAYWKWAVDDFEHRATYEKKHIPIMDAADYTYERFRDATENFLRPAVVRGLFNSTNAVQYWGNLEYMKQVFHEDFPVVVTANGTGGESLSKLRMSFHEAITEIYNNDNRMYLQYPMSGRSANKKDGNSKLTNATDSMESRQQFHKILMKELDIENLFGKPGFGSTELALSSMLLGKGSDNPKETTGYKWHFEPSENFNIHVHGTKYIELLSPKYSKLLFPVKNSIFVVQSGHKDAQALVHKMPIEYAVVQPGDMFYVPAFYWHNVKNREGLAIGCPFRQVHFIPHFRSSVQYTFVMMLTNILASGILTALGFNSIVERSFFDASTMATIATAARKG